MGAPGHGLMHVYQGFELLLWGGMRLFLKCVMLGNFINSDDKLHLLSWK